MPRNVGTIDRWIRIALGIAILALVFVGPRSSWAYLGVIPLLTGIFGYCPLYHATGIDTVRSRPAHTLPR